ncbi:lysozyme [Hyphococcus sp.]|uniref:lysozyme n=1 Tax=Hyphococcus sp. TaxID=2038636 RepID=UPI003CCC033B
MRFQLIVWIIIFVLGVLVGDRYGAPGFVSNLAKPAFQSVEGFFGALDEPIPDARNGEPESPAQTETTSNEAQTPPAVFAPSGALTENADLRINDAGLQIIKDSEGMRLDAYNAGGQWYIGYGHTRTAREGMTITEEDADRLLREDVRASEATVRNMVGVPMNENQFSAMVSLAYNLGAGGFSRTTVLERINEGDYQGAADGFLIHDRVRVDGELQSAAHLTERRKKERTLFLTPA